MHKDTNGILIVDKPKDITSATVVSRIKKIPGIDKVGHTGTLDPIATGVMACVINKATRLSRFFLHSKKKYDAILKLGAETDTQDATGQILSEKKFDGISDIAIKETCGRYVGETEQVPPVYSALKHNGVPLYKYARNGTPVEKPPRKVQIFGLTVKKIRLPEVRFEVECSAGTYIRTLCADIGKELGCGGHLAKLTRLESGRFCLKDAMALDDIENCPSLEKLSPRLISMADALYDMPQVLADKVLTEKIKYGKILTKTDIQLKEGEIPSFIKIINNENQLLSVLSPAKDEDLYNYCCVFHYP